MARRFASIVAVAMLGAALVACQRDDGPSAQGAAGNANAAREAAQKQSIIGLARTLKNRVEPCASDPPNVAAPGASSKAFATAWATAERAREANCTQLMTDLGSGTFFPQDWPEDQKASFRRALNTYAKYVAQNMSRSRNAAMFVESVADDADSRGEIERYTKTVGSPSPAFRDRGEQMFRQAAKVYGVSARDLHLPDS